MNLDAVRLDALTANNATPPGLPVEWWGPHPDTVPDFELVPLWRVDVARAADPDYLHDCRLWVAALVPGGSLDDAIIYAAGEHRVIRTTTVLNADGSWRRDRATGPLPVRARVLRLLPQDAKLPR